MTVSVSFSNVEELRGFLYPAVSVEPKPTIDCTDAKARVFKAFAAAAGASTMDEVYGDNVAICEKLDKLFQMMFGSTADKIVLGRAMPMNFEINGITVIEMFAKECPQWAEVAKKYRELLAQPTTLYRNAE